MISREPVTALSGMPPAIAFAKMARSAAEMTDMLRVRNPNAIGFPASGGPFEMSTEVATGEIALVG